MAHLGRSAGLAPRSHSFGFDESVWLAPMLGCGPPADALRCVVRLWFVFGGRGWVASPPFVGNEIADGHRLVTVGTAAAWAHPATEALTVRAALLAEIPRPTRRTLVHRR